MFKMCLIYIYHVGIAPKCKPIVKENSDKQK